MQALIIDAALVQNYDRPTVRQTYGGEVYTVQCTATRSTGVQSCKMSIYLHRANLSSQLLPQKKQVNRDKLNA